MIPNMPNTPTAPAASAAQKLLAYRIGGWGLVLIVTAVAAYFHDTAPWLVWFAEALAGIVGKLVGAPMQEVTQQVLRRMPADRAVDLTIAALESHPPAATEAVAAKLLASLPPDAHARVSLTPPRPVPVVFTGLTTEGDDT